MISRAERSLMAQWWWTIDRVLLAALTVLMVVGLVFLMAASPAVAERLGRPAFHFVHRQMIYLCVANVLLVGASFFSPRAVRRAALILFLVSMGLVFATLLFGVELNGAQRWIFGMQPSEFLKPAFVVLAAWSFAERLEQKDMPAYVFALGLLPITILPLILQPDIGQTILISLVWASLLFISGLHWLLLVSLGLLSAIGAVAAYSFMPHVRMRILRFLDPASASGWGDTFQVDTAFESFLAGGWFGRGVGEGVMKRILPDAHTDFIFAVIGEEFGILACLALVALFCFIVLHGLRSASQATDPFCRFAAAGLMVLFGLQSVINMAVNLQLLPAKGMTLPFISYGGSSLMSLGIAMGFLLAVGRKRPQVP